MRVNEIFYSIQGEGRYTSKANEDCRSAAIPALRQSSFALLDAISDAISAIRSTSPTKTSPKRRSCGKSPIFRPRTS